MFFSNSPRVRAAQPSRRPAPEDTYHDEVTGKMQLFTIGQTLVVVFGMLAC